MENFDVIPLSLGLKCNNCNNTEDAEQVLRELADQFGYELIKKEITPTPTKTDPQDAAYQAPHACPICDFIAKSKRGLAVHISKTHGTPTILPNEKSKKLKPQTQASIDALAETRAEKEKNWCKENECPPCGKQYSSKGFLWAHLKKKHNDPAFEGWSGSQINEYLRDIPNPKYKSAEEMPTPYFEALRRKLEKQNAAEEQGVD